MMASCQQIFSFHHEFTDGKQKETELPVPVKYIPCICSMF